MADDSPTVADSESVKTEIRASGCLANKFTAGQSCPELRTPALGTAPLLHVCLTDAFCHAQREAWKLAARLCKECDARRGASHAASMAAECFDTYMCAC